MRCPFCGNSDTSVKDSRNTDDQSSIRRRRVCTACGSRFTTFERVQLRDLNVIKKSGAKVPFNRDKLFASVKTACQNRDIDDEVIERVINSIIRQLETSGESEISTSSIGDRVMEALETLDPVAYVRFASVYKKFDNIGDFVSLIQKMS